jgi:ATP-dependent Clp protease ATP-binding subunit ClpB
MNINKYTEKAQEAIAAAQQIAEQSSHAQIEPEHVLVALAEQREGVVPELLRKMNVDPAAVARAARELLGKMPQAYGGSQPGLSPRLKLVTDLAEAEAQRLKDEFVSTEHLLVAIASETGRSPSAKLLTDRGITGDKIFNALTSIRGSQRVTSQNPEGTYQALERYGRDLTDLARKGKLDPVIGRDEEIRRVVQILSGARRTTQCFGEPGVGKTAIVEGLAIRIIRGDVPEASEQAHRRARHGRAGGRRQVSRRVRGAAEGRAQEIADSENQIVLIDELHAVVGARRRRGSIDASNVLKPMLARGELHTIGATTLDEYRVHPRRTRRSNVVFNRSPSANRPSRTRSASCAVFASDIKSTTKVNF